MLDSGKIKVFVVLSVVMHVFFALMFNGVTVKPTVLPDKKLSLLLVAREASKTGIVQSTGAWPLPRRLQPALPAGQTLESLNPDIMRWAQVGLPDASYFSPKETIVPQIQIADLAEKAHEGTPTEVFAQLPAESKSMPIADFALGPAFPEFSGIDVDK